MTEYLAAAPGEWRDPDVDPPPIGSKVQLLTHTGIAIHGKWYPEGRFIGWAPLLKIPPSIKAKIK